MDCTLRVEPNTQREAEGKGKGTETGTGGTGAPDLVLIVTSLITIEPYP